MCEYCKLLSGDREILEENRETEIAIGRVNKDYYIEAGNDYDSIDININYCPFCGRKLSEQNMCADEMFDELGYEKYDNHPEEEKPEVNKWTTQDCRVIEYKQSETIRGELYTLYIRFHVVGERIEIGADKRPQEIRTMSLKVNPILNIKELQAINKKVEELGWMK